ncbi:DUF4232 domain-containing protein [Actinoplanes sp. N902-109]|uniref:DUF4232 domain-containing protein n=1 Tax=Actinoplanes sp. (strain N902-109) TaxID=649831 RepID=UPI000A0276F8|nr:DUF4232 domain-containing protein [Actinoplanes sp. N902-109]
MRDVRRTMLLVTGTTGLLLAAAGCAGTASAPAASGGSGAAAATGSSTAAASPGPSSRTGNPGGSDDGGPGGESPRCHTGDLKITDRTAEGGGAAGHHSEYLLFENITGHACSLKGYPGVSFVTGDSGEQVGSAFTRTPADAPLIMLTPGDRVHATILIANPDNAGAADCKPVQTRGYRVYPPDETASAFVSHPGTACSAQGQAVGQVRPISPKQTD